MEEYKGNRSRVPFALISTLDEGEQSNSCISCSFLWKLMLSQYFHVQGINYGFLSSKQTELQGLFSKFYTYMLAHLSWK